MTAGPWARVMAQVNPPTIQAGVLAVGIILGGWLAGRGFAAGRAADRFVTVKGVAEREVKADLALWPLRVVATNNDLSQAQATVSRDVERLREFLLRHGIDTAQAELQEVQVTDNWVNAYRPADAPIRYVVRQTLMVRSGDPAKILAASQRVGDLVSAGVVLASQEYGSGTGPTFLFTRLNDIKPGMIAEATANARAAAEQFAKDSRTTLRGIRQASQGVFVILPRDQALGISEQNQVDKIVRVVSTVEYFLR